VKVSNGNYLWISYLALVIPPVVVKEDVA